MGILSSFISYLDIIIRISKVIFSLFKYPKVSVARPQSENYVFGSKVNQTIKESKDTRKSPFFYL